MGASKPAWSMRPAWSGFASGLAAWPLSLSAPVDQERSDVSFVWSRPKEKADVARQPSEKMERLLRLLHSLLHFLLLHRQRDYVNFVLGCIFMRLYFHFVSFVALHCVWITDCPALVVFTTHEGLSVVADFAG